MLEVAHKMSHKRDPYPLCLQSQIGGSCGLPHRSNRQHNNTYLHFRVARTNHTYLRHRHHNVPNIQADESYQYLKTAEKWKKWNADSKSISLITNVAESEIIAISKKTDNACMLIISRTEKA